MLSFGRKRLEPTCSTSCSKQLKNHLFDAFAYWELVGNMGLFYIEVIYGLDSLIQYLEPVSL